SDCLYYRPSVRVVIIPRRELFTTAAELCATAYHELIHSTGHKARLAREGLCEAVPFGSPVYPKEDLIAECSAAYLCAEAGISNAVVNNQAAYLADGSRRFVVIASCLFMRQRKRSVRLIIPSIFEREDKELQGINSRPDFRGGVARDDKCAELRSRPCSRDRR